MTMNILARPYLSLLFESVTAMTIQKLAPSAAEVNHFRPLMMYSLSSKFAVVSIHVGFDPGLPGSVIAKQLLMFPATSGSRNVLF